MYSNGKSQDDSSTQETKQLIINISQKLFMTYGYRAVSTRQIAEACDVTQPALYHHFENKKMIYIEVVRHIMERTKTDLYRIKRQHTSFKSRFYHISVYILTNQQENLSQMFHDIQHEMNDETQQLIRKWWMDSYLNPVVEIIEDAVKLKEIRNLDTINSNVTEIAFFILDLMKSFLQSSASRKLSEIERKEEAEKKSSLIVTIFLEGLSGQ